MSDLTSTKSVERLFPFVLKSRILLIGRDTLRRSKSKLHFVLITTDLSEGSRAQILTDFSHYPIIQKYTSTELDKFFGIKGAKVVGFAKSGLAQSIYAEMKELRINRPVEKPKPAGSLPAPPSGQKAS
jgi:hypothetical protein